MNYSLRHKESRHTSTGGWDLLRVIADSKLVHVIANALLPNSLVRVFLNLSFRNDADSVLLQMKDGR